MHREVLAHLRALLGEAVLLPVPERQKGCKLRGWPFMTFARSRQAKHMRALLKAGNVGVLLGAPSGHLVTVDCDSDAGLEAFLGLNPTLRKSLITRGARGGNVWLRMSGPYPRTVKLGARGGWGEFRATDSQTIITGIHQDGHAYTMVHEAAPLVVAFESLRWPSEATSARGWNYDAPASQEADRLPDIGAAPGRADAEGTQGKEEESSPLSLHLSRAF